MAYLDDIAAYARNASAQGDPQAVLAAAQFFYGRFTGFERPHWMEPQQCTDAALRIDGFRLSYGPDHHLIYANRGKRWCVSDRPDSLPHPTDAHDLAVNITSAPYAFLEGVAFAFECIESMRETAKSVANASIGFESARLEHIASQVANLSREHGDLCERTKRPKFVKMAVSKTSVEMKADGAVPPSPPLQTVSLPIARKVYCGVSGVYFLWANDRIEYIGRGDCISTRLSPSHHVAREHHYVSVVRMSIADSWANEPYYIWKYRPPLNGEIRKSDEASGKKATSDRQEPKSDTRPIVCSRRQPPATAKRTSR